MFTFFRTIPIPGAFYEVSFEKERVIKRRRSDKGLLFFDFFFADPSPRNLFNIIFNTRKKLDTIKSHFDIEEDIVRNVPASLIGNIMFSTNGYKQTKVHVFRDISKTNEQYIQNFRKWISAIQELWIYGYHDQSMNFDINSGFDENENCVLFDINEFTNNFNITLDEIQNRKWYKQHSFWRIRFVGNQILRTKILEIINTEFTESNLRKLWNSQRKTI